MWFFAYFLFNFREISSSEGRRSRDSRFFRMTSPHKILVLYLAVQTLDKVVKQKSPSVVLASCRAATDYSFFLATPIHKFLFCSFLVANWTCVPLRIFTIWDTKKCLNLYRDSFTIKPTPYFRSNVILESISGGFWTFGAGKFRKNHLFRPWKTSVYKSVVG